MKTALFIYILLGVLSIVPLVAFNIRKIWVRRPPDPIRFKPFRFGVILVICLFIVKASYDILKDGVVKLLDTSCGETYDKKMEEYIARQDGVVCVDTLRSRMFGNKVYIDLEIQVDGEKISAGRP